MNNDMTTPPIKFRGFRVDGKGWVEGLLAYYKPDDSWGIVWWDSEGSHIVHIHPSSLGMFTGRHDKNGKEIYGAIGVKGGDMVRETNFGFDGSEYFEERIVVLDFSILTEPIYPEYTEIIGNQWEVDNGK